MRCILLGDEKSTSPFLLSEISEILCETSLRTATYHCPRPSPSPTFQQPAPPPCVRCSSQALDEAARRFSVEDVDVWQIIYAPVCFIVGFRFFFYLALVYKHSGSRK